jgi:RNA exonuclease 1
VQSYLLSNLITPRTILLGHSLESDLKALKLKHPWCIDTAILFKHPKGPPYKPGLKYLAKTLLEKEIQTGEGGHDPEEDARTCLELLEMKLKLGESALIHTYTEASTRTSLTVRLPLLL